MKRRALLLGLTLATAAHAGEPVVPPSGTADVFRQFANILECLQKNYVAPQRIREAQPTTTAFRAYVRALDPEADFLTPEEAKAARHVAPSANTNVQFTVLSPGLTYCRVPEFNAPVVEQLAAELPRIRKLILDLRNNSGGAVDPALRAARLFLPPKAEVVTLDYADPGHRTMFIGDADAGRFTAPVVVLVNGGTAAEAEIVAAALQGNKRARLVGSRTAGRGRLISTFPLADGSALRLPTARYLAPGQQLIDKHGLTPDVVVDAPATGDAADPVLLAARQLLAK